MNRNVQMLILAAYEEGFRDGVDHECNNWKHYPKNLGWLASQSRIDAMFPELTPAQKYSMDLWDAAKIDAQRDAEREVLP